MILRSYVNTCYRLQYQICDNEVDSHSDVKMSVLSIISFTVSMYQQNIVDDGEQGIKVMSTCISPNWYKPVIVVYVNGMQQV